MNILIASSIDKAAIDHLSREHKVTCMFGAGESALQEAMPQQDVLVFRSGVQITRVVLEAADNLKLIVRAGSGMDNIDWQYANERDIPIFRIPGPGARAVAELSFAMMIALSRQMLRADRSMRDSRWIKGEITGFLLQNKTLGIVGAGNIGSLVGKLGHAWGMNVIGCTESPGDDDVERLAAIGIELRDFDSVLSKSDYISVHVPLQDSTRNLIDAAALRQVRPGAFLVNLARGGVVDELALRDALLEGRILGAALDVHGEEGKGKTSPLVDLDNVILTPHIGANAIDAQREIGRIIIDAVRTFEENAHKVA